MRRLSRRQMDRTGSIPATVPKAREVVLFFLYLAFTVQAHSSDLRQYSASIHVHSTFSNGHYDVMELASFSNQRQIDVLVLTDSFLTSAVYGIWPLDRLGIEGVNKHSRAGVLDRGISDYLAAAREAQDRFPGVLILPGVEVTPCYYWTGMPWDELTLHDFDRHLLVLGLSEPELKNLPVIGNATWSNASKEWRLILPPLLLLIAGAALLCVRRRKRIQLRYYTIVARRRLWAPALILLGAGALLAWNNYPFGRICDPYSSAGDIVPYQRLIDYVLGRGGTVYWSYPEANYPEIRRGGARLLSQSHPEDLLLTHGYHGFEGIYGDRITATRPGETWDQALMQYLEGQRDTPPFAITGIDFHYFHSSRGRWYELDGGQTMVLAREKSPAAILDALQRGHCYATFQELDEKVRLQEFFVQISQQRAIQGEEIQGTSPVQVHFEINWLNEAPAQVEPFQLNLIRNGEVIEAFEGRLPLTVSREYELSSGRYYFRLRATSRQGYEVLSNPIFLRVRGIQEEAGRDASPQIARIERR